MIEFIEPWRQRAIDFGLPLGLLFALGLVLFADHTFNGRKPMDIVFILDEGAGMVEFAEPIKRNWQTIVQSLTSEGIDCRVAVIPCLPESSQIPRIPLTSDIADFERRLSDARSDPEDPDQIWPVTSSLEGLEDVLKLEFRKDASPVVYLTTNNVVEDDDRLKRIAEQFRDRGIETIIQANWADEEQFRVLCENGGRFYTLAGEAKSVNSDSKRDEDNVDLGNLLSPAVQRKSGDVLPEAEQQLVGVKVRGRIALVCDISGSMRRDFPPLIAELREKFPQDTPLILVGGCYFGAPNPAFQSPRLDVTRDGLKPVNGKISGVDFSDDQHVYTATSTTDAIILAVKEFKRDTVMFNNDLQDSGTIKAIEALEEVWKQRRFTLSGRSLNRDAPQVLMDFIQKTNGDFKVDPINRVVAPPVDWGP